MVVPFLYGKLRILNRLTEYLQIILVHASTKDVNNFILIGKKLFLYYFLFIFFIYYIFNLSKLTKS